MTPPGKARRRVGGYSWRSRLEEIEDEADEAQGLLRRLSGRAETEEAQRMISTLMSHIYEIRSAAGELKNYRGGGEEREQERLVEE